MNPHSITSALAALFLVSSTNTATAVTIDFENLSDLSPVNSTYTAQGVLVQNAISLTAGVSLNEFDFPPSSGSIVIGDDVINDGDPMIITFLHSSDSVSAFFSYASTLTFTAFDPFGTLLGEFSTATSSMLGLSEQIIVPYNGLGSLHIAGSEANSFTMDDLSFEPNLPASLPDGGSTLGLLGITLLSLLPATWRSHRPIRPRHE